MKNEGEESATAPKTPKIHGDGPPTTALRPVSRFSTEEQLALFDLFLQDIDLMDRAKAVGADVTQSVRIVKTNEITPGGRPIVLSVSGSNEATSAVIETVRNPTGVRVRNEAMPLRLAQASLPAKPSGKDETKTPTSGGSA